MTPRKSSPRCHWHWGNDPCGAIDTVEIHCLSNISANTKPYAKRHKLVNQGPRWVFLMNKTEGQKSRATFPLSKSFTVFICKGRVHVYEGVPLWKIAVPVRVMKMLGVRNPALSLQAFTQYYSETHFLDFANRKINSLYMLGDAPFWAKKTPCKKVHPKRDLRV
jgi:hypothetical protein